MTSRRIKMSRIKSLFNPKKDKEFEDQVIARVY